MHPLFALALVIAAGIGVTRLSRGPLRYPAPLSAIFAAGAPFVLLGILLGPGLGVLDAPALRSVSPIFALGIGWIGASFGAALEWRMLRRWRVRVWSLGAALAGVVFLVSGLAVYALRQAVPALAAAWSPGVAVILTLAGAMTVSGGWPLGRRPRLGHHTALFDTIAGAVAAALALALLRHAVPRSLVLTLVGSGLLAALFIALAHGQSERSTSLAIEFAGVLALGAGFGYAAGLSPFLICALIAGLVVSLSPRDVRLRVQRVLRAWEAPLYAAFLILAGALLRLPTLWLVPAALLLLTVRVATRWVVTRFDIPRVWPPLGTEPPPAFAPATMRQGTAAIALAAGFDLIRGDAGGHAVLTAVLIAVLIGEAWAAAATPLTSATRRAEVT